MRIGADRQRQQAIGCGSNQRGPRDALMQTDQFKIFNVVGAPQHDENSANHGGDAASLNSSPPWYTRASITTLQCHRSFWICSSPPKHRQMRIFGKKGVPTGKIFFTGNVMIDRLKGILEAARQSTILNWLNLANRKYGMLTLPRPSNVDDREQLCTSLSASRDRPENSGYLSGSSANGSASTGARYSNALLGRHYIHPEAWYLDDAPTSYAQHTRKSWERFAPS